MEGAPRPLTSLAFVHLLDHCARGENRYGLTSDPEDDQDTQLVQVCVGVCICGVCGV